jgi:hypothetical protein
MGEPIKPVRRIVTIDDARGASHAVIERRRPTRTDRRGRLRLDASG